MDSPSITSLFSGHSWGVGCSQRSPSQLSIAVAGFSIQGTGFIFAFFLPSTEACLYHLPAFLFLTSYPPLFWDQFSSWWSICLFNWFHPTFSPPSSYTSRSSPRPPSISWPSSWAYLSNLYHLSQFSHFTLPCLHTALFCTCRRGSATPVIVFSCSGLLSVSNFTSLCWWWCFSWGASSCFLFFLPVWGILSGVLFFTVTKGGSWFLGNTSVP